MLPRYFHDQLNELLLEKSEQYLSFNERTLEIGSHEGRLTKSLSDLVPEKNLITLDRYLYINKYSEVSVRADAEQLPFKPDAFDWVVSGGTFQWFENEGRALRDLLTFVKPGGILSFSQFTQGSMEPLSSCLRLLGESQRLLQLKTEREVSALVTSDLWECLEIQEVQGSDWFGHFSESFRFLRDIGATRSLDKRPLKKSVYRNLSHRLESFKTARGCPLHWKAMVVVLRKPLLVCEGR